MPGFDLGLRQKGQVVGEVVGGAQSVGVVGAQDPPAGVEGGLVELVGFLVAAPGRLPYRSRPDWVQSPEGSGHLTALCVGPWPDPVGFDQQVELVWVSRPSRQGRAL